MAIVRIAANDNAQQILFENLGYVCVGFQPLKHMLQQRVGILFYVSGANSVLVTRNPLSESLPQVSELGTAALEKLQIPNAISSCGTALAATRCNRISKSTTRRWMIMSCGECKPKAPIRRPRFPAALIAASG
jgi:hypothetical protein